MKPKFKSGDTVYAVMGCDTLPVKCKVKRSIQQEPFPYMYRMENGALLGELQLHTTMVACLLAKLLTEEKQHLSKIRAITKALERALEQDNNET